MNQFLKLCRLYLLELSFAKIALFDDGGSSRVCWGSGSRDWLGPGWDRGFTSGDEGVGGCGEGDEDDGHPMGRSSLSSQQNRGFLSEGRG